MRGGGSGNNGEPDGPGGEEHPWNEPSESRGEDPALEDLPEHVLEGAVLRPHGGDSRRQGDGARPPRGHVRWQPQAHPLHVPHIEDAPDPARQGDSRRVH